MISRTIAGSLMRTDSVLAAAVVSADAVETSGMAISAEAVEISGVIVDSEAVETSGTIINSQVLWISAAAVSVDVVETSGVEMPPTITEEISSVPAAGGAPKTVLAWKRTP